MVHRKHRLQAIRVPGRTETAHMVSATALPIHSDQGICAESKFVQFESVSVALPVLESTSYP